jgi:hypothetical protein
VGYFRTDAIECGRIRGRRRLEILEELFRGERLGSAANAMLAHPSLLERRMPGLVVRWEI